jgi:uncharacterized protein YbcI
VNVLSQAGGLQRPPAFKAHMKTQGEIEAAICESMVRFEQEYMGGRPNHIHAHLIGDLLVVRFRGLLTASQQQLTKLLPAEKGRDLLKQLRRQHLILLTRPVMEAMIREITGVKIMSLHQDVSTVTGEEFVLFRLAERVITSDRLERSNGRKVDARFQHVILHESPTLF